MIYYDTQPQASPNALLKPINKTTCSQDQMSRGKCSIGMKG